MTQVIEIVRMPLIEEIAPAETFVLKIAFEFFTTEKHSMKVRNLLAKKLNKRILLWGRVTTDYFILQSFPPPPSIV